ncbi:MAG: helix-turn-helix transcriptional regulator [Trueperaceae bacterium]|nr:helix-turn-helix transcriptional regulator [Trueperaceae bacterium]
MAKKQFGKNARGGYRSVTGRVPEDIKRRAKAKAALDGLDINEVVEGLLSLYAAGTVTASTIRAAVEADGPPPPAPSEARAPAPGRREVGSPGGAPAPERVRTIRKEQGLTQTKLGELLGKSRATVSGYERGEPLPPEVEARLDEIERGAG